jgi:hypothetical protein
MVGAGLGAVIGRRRESDLEWDIRRMDAILGPG